MGQAILGTDSEGVGRRMLSVFSSGPVEEIIVRVINGAVPVRCDVEITRTDFTDGDSCSGGCEDLLQLPLPMQPAEDGYRMTSHSIFRYQFGRRDVVMYFRDVARKMRRADYGTLIPLDLSQWDGATPGVDVGSPRHSSHKRGIDIDIGLLDNSATSRLREFCDTTPAAQKNAPLIRREFVYAGAKRIMANTVPLVCKLGTAHDFNAYAVAKMLGLFFSNGSVRMSFLDQELLTMVRDASELALRDGLITPAVRKLFFDGVHLQKWTNHFDHIHVRFKEVKSSAASRRLRRATKSGIAARDIV